MKAWILEKSLKLNPAVEISYLNKQGEVIGDIKYFYDGELLYEKTVELNMELQPNTKEYIKIHPLYRCILNYFSISSECYRVASQEPRKAISRKKVYSVMSIHVIYRMGLMVHTRCPRAQHGAQHESPCLFTG